MHFFKEGWRFWMTNCSKVLTGVWVEHAPFNMANCCHQHWHSKSCSSYNIIIYLHAAISNNLWHDTIEGQLFVKGLDALMSRIVELPCAVKVQNVPEHFRVSVKEVFLCVLTVEKLLLWGAQQCVWIAIQSVLPCLDMAEQIKSGMWVLMNWYIKNLFHLFLLCFVDSQIKNGKITRVELDW